MYDLTKNRKTFSTLLRRSPPNFLLPTKHNVLVHNRGKDQTLGGIARKYNSRKQRRIIYCWVETILHYLRISTSCISRLVSSLF